MVDNMRMAQGSVETTLANTLNEAVDVLGDTLYGLRTAEGALQTSTVKLDELYIPHQDMEPFPTEAAIELAEAYHSNRKRLQAKLEASDLYRAATYSLINTVRENRGTIVNVAAISGQPLETVRYQPHSQQTIDTPDAITARLDYMHPGTDLWLSSRKRLFNVFRAVYVAHMIDPSSYKRQITFTDN